MSQEVAEETKAIQDVLKEGLGVGRKAIGGLTQLAQGLSAARSKGMTLDRSIHMDEFTRRTVRDFPTERGPVETSRPQSRGFGREPMGVREASRTHAETGKAASRGAAVAAAPVAKQRGAMPNPFAEGIFARMVSRRRPKGERGAGLTTPLDREATMSITALSKGPSAPAPLPIALLGRALGGMGR